MASHPPAFSKFLAQSHSQYSKNHHFISIPEPLPTPSRPRPVHAASLSTLASNFSLHFPFSDVHGLVSLSSPPNHQKACSIIAISLPTQLFYHSKAGKFSIVPTFNVLEYLLFGLMCGFLARNVSPPSPLHRIFPARHPIFCFPQFPFPQFFH